MAELGSGNGTSYPSSLDVDNTVEADSSTTARADVPNDLAAAIIAVQTELGTDPAGSLTDVKTFLQAQHNTDGTHGDLTCDNLTVNKTFIGKLGADVSSASALAVNIDGNMFDVTGTTGITSINTKGVGTTIVLQFDGIVTLTDDGDNLKLGGSNITTSAGSVLTLYEYATGKWRLIAQSTVADSIPSGLIAIWSGAVSAIPSGWVICDGTNSTPDLTGQFVIHADADSGGTYNVGNSGGSTTTGASSLSIAQLAAHTHTYNNQNVRAQGGDNALDAAIHVTANTGSTGSGATHSHSSTIPPYYALAYIMKS